MNNEQIKKEIQDGSTSLGIELGSTRIKAVLIASDCSVIASGNHEWKSTYKDGIFTYDETEIWQGIQESYKELKQVVRKMYGLTLTNIGQIGISAMMHGYMAFNANDELLVPFRTWQNTITQDASKKLTTLFDYKIPQRCSIAHLYQAMLNQEDHVKDIDFLATLAGYVHYKLTGVKAIGVGEASGMFPIDLATRDYNQQMVVAFDQLVKTEGYAWNLLDILPKVFVAGEDAGTLTNKGALLLDVSGELHSGSLCCPAEGDAGTGMVATNAVAMRTGNISAGTSTFAMVVLEKELSKVYDAIDVVTTPSGELVAMVHVNNCTSDLNAWMSMFEELLATFGTKVSKHELFTTLFKKALEGDVDCGGLLNYNYLSGEHITEIHNGRPLFVRKPTSRFTLANFMRTQLYASFGVLKLGMDILLKEEHVALDCMYGHGGFFKTEEVGQRILAAALRTPIALMETAGEGGAWGIAVLAQYLTNNKKSLAAYLSEDVFKESQQIVVQPHEDEAVGFDTFMENYVEALPVVKLASEIISE
ncbi:ATPase [Erysipelotrichaceae bacterium MTC7]|nr:ATPase [Erysipelotrichaceae bacterium MTC7]